MYIILILSYTPFIPISFKTRIHEICLCFLGNAVIDQPELALGLVRWGQTRQPRGEQLWSGSCMCLVRRRQQVEVCKCRDIGVGVSPQQMYIVYTYINMYNIKELCVMYGIWCAMYMIMNNVYMIDMWYEECICMIYSIDIDNSFSVYIMYAIYENDDILYTNEINDSCNLYGLYSLWNTYDLWLLICMLYMVYIIYNRYFCLICMMYTQKNILCSIYNLILQHTYIYIYDIYIYALWIGVI